MDFAEKQRWTVCFMQKHTIYFIPDLGGLWLTLRTHDEWCWVDLITAHGTLQHQAPQPYGPRDTDCDCGLADHPVKKRQAGRNGISLRWGIANHMRPWGLLFHQMQIWFHEGSYLFNYWPFNSYLSKTKHARHLLYYQEMLQYCMKDIDLFPS